MANHAYVALVTQPDPLEVDALVRNLVATKLGNAFHVEYNDPHQMWIISYPPVPDDLSFAFWLTSSSMVNGRPYLLEFRHGHTYNFMWWVEGVIRENLGAHYNGYMLDEGAEIDSTPHPEKYASFEIFAGQNREHWIKGADRAPQSLLTSLNIIP